MKKYLKRYASLDDDTHIQLMLIDPERKLLHDQAIDNLKQNIDITKNLQIIFKMLINCRFIQSRVLYQDITLRDEHSLDFKILYNFAMYLLQRDVKIKNFDDEHILHSSIKNMPEYEQVIDEIIDEIDQINEALGLYGENKIIASADTKLLNQYLEEARNTVDKNVFEEKIEKIFDILVQEQQFALVISEFALMQVYIADTCMKEFIKLDVLQTFYDYLVDQNVNIELYDEELFANSEIVKEVVEYTTNMVINTIEHILLNKLNQCKTASSTDQAMQGVISDGRKILQMLENMKFKIEQTARISGNDQQLAKKIMQNSDLIDKIMSGLYSVCFGLQNLDISPVYNLNQINISDDAKPDSEKSKFKLEQQDEVKENEQDKETEEPVEPVENADDSEDSEDEQNKEDVEEETESENGEEQEESEEK